MSPNTFMERFPCAGTVLGAGTIMANNAAILDFLVKHRRVQMKTTKQNTNRVITLLEKEIRCY